MPYVRYVVGVLLSVVSLLFILSARTVDAAPLPAVTHHVAVIGGKPVAYTATAGTMEVTGLGGQSRANLFYIAYTVGRQGGNRPRPLTFAYNGGPGGSSALVHMAAFGPRTLRLADAGPPSSPQTIIDNPDSLLDISDLVFIDPVGSGYSRLLPGRHPTTSTA